MAATKECHRRLRFTIRSRAEANAGRLLAATAVLTCLLLAWATGVMPTSSYPSPAVEVRAVRQVYLGQKGTPTATATIGPTPTPTSTAPVTPPTIQLISPSSGQGPVGAHLTVEGANFTSSEAHLFGSTHADCSVSSGALTSATVTGGNISATFIWPVSLPIGTYYICSDGMTSSTATYEVLTSSPPVLGLSTSSIQMGQPLAIQGSNFAGAAGAAVTLTETTPGTGGSGPRTLPINAILDGSGSFSVTWTVDGPYTGAVTIKADAESEGSSPAVLQASATATIQPAVTPTATVSATPSVGAASGGGSTSTPASGSSTGTALLIILLITGIILTMLVIVGLVVFLTLHRRGGGGRYQGSGSGPAEPGPATGYAAYGGYQDYGPYTMPPGGQVAEWDDPDSQPGPNWRPRPMTGYYPQFDIRRADPPEPTPGWSRSWPAPADPWNDREEHLPDPDSDQWPDLGGNGDDSWP